MIESYQSFFTKTGAEEKGISPDREINTILASIFKPKTIEKGMFFLRQGEPSDDMALVVSGLFRSYYITEGGNDVTKYFYPEGSKLFSYEAYIHRENSTYGIQALEDSQIITAKISEFEKAAKNNHQLLWYYKKTLDEMLLMKEEYTGHLKMLNNAERYQAFLACYPGLEKRVKQYQIASFLGMTPVSLSRIKKQAHINK